MQGESTDADPAAFSFWNLLSWIFPSRYIGTSQMGASASPAASSASTLEEDLSPTSVALPLSRDTSSDAELQNSSISSLAHNVLSVTLAEDLSPENIALPLSRNTSGGTELQNTSTSSPAHGVLSVTDMLATYRAAALAVSPESTPASVKSTLLPTLSDVLAVRSPFSGPQGTAGWGSPSGMHRGSPLRIEWNSQPESPALGLEGRELEVYKLLRDIDRSWSWGSAAASGSTGLSADSLKNGVEFIFQDPDLGTLISFADSLGLPILRHVAVRTYQIISLAGSARKNQRGFKAVTDKTSRLIHQLVNTLSMDSSDIQSLRPFIDSLTSQLHDVKKVMEAASGINYISHDTHTPPPNGNISDDIRDLQRCTDILAQALHTLKIKSIPAPVPKSTAQVFSGASGALLRNSSVTNAGRDIHIYNNFIPEQRLTVSTALSLRLPPIPPPVPVPFVGREELVSLATSTISNTPGANIAILGAGGMGKTSLALAIMHNDEIKKKFNNKCYFVSCETVKSPDMLVSSILHALGYQEYSYKDSVATLKAILLAEGEFLVVLDNFEITWNQSSSFQEVQDVLIRISTMENITLMITMRGIDPPSGVIWTSFLPPNGVPALSPNAAKEMFLHSGIIIDDFQDPENELELLLQELDYMPLAISLVAPQANYFNASQLLKRWKAEKTKLLQIHGPQAHDRMSNIEISIYLSLECFGIVENAEAIKLLFVISCLPDGVWKWQEKIEVMIPNLENVHQNILFLCGTSLLYQTPDALKMLSPIRHYVNDRYSATHQKELADIQMYYMALVQKHNNPSQLPYDTIQELAAAENNILSIFQTGLKLAPSGKLIDAAMAFSIFLNEIQPTTLLLEEILRIPEVKNIHDLSARCNLQLGYILLLKGDYNKAKIQVEEACGQFSLAHDKDGMATSFQSLADICQRENDYEGAQKNFELALLQYKNSNNTLSMAKTLQCLGDILKIQDNYTEAHSHYMRAIARFGSIDDDDFPQAKNEALLGMAQCLKSRGDLLYLGGKYTDAKRQLKSAQGEFNKISDLLGMAQCQKSIGNILYMQGKYKTSHSELGSALELFYKIHSQLDIAQCLRSLGNVLYMEGKYEEAQLKLEDAYELFIHLKNQHGTAQCLQSLGNILGIQNQYEEAQKLVDFALQKFTSIGDQQGMAECLQSLGNILYMKSNYSEARKKFTAAYNQLTNIGSQEGMGWCLWMLGETAKREERYTDACENLGQALRIFGIISSERPEPHMIICLQTLGDCLKMDHKYESARMKLLAACEQFRLIHDQKGMAWCIWSVGDTFRMQGRHSEADEKLTYALNLFRGIGDFAGISVSLESLKKLWEHSVSYKPYSSPKGPTLKPMHGLNIKIAASIPTPTSSHPPDSARIQTVTATLNQPGDQISTTPELVDQVVPFIYQPQPSTSLIFEIPTVPDV